MSTETPPSLDVIFGLMPKMESRNGLPHDELEKAIESMGDGIREWDAPCHNWHYKLPLFLRWVSPKGATWKVKMRDNKAQWACTAQSVGGYDHSPSGRDL